MPIDSPIFILKKRKNDWRVTRQNPSPPEKGEGEGEGLAQLFYTFTYLFNLFLQL